MISVSANVNPAQPTHPTQLKGAWAKVDKHFQDRVQSALRDIPQLKGSNAPSFNEQRPSISTDTDQEHVLLPLSDFKEAIGSTATHVLSFYEALQKKPDNEMVLNGFLSACQEHIHSAEDSSKLQTFLQGASIHGISLHHALSKAESLSSIASSSKTPTFSSLPSLKDFKKDTALGLLQPRKGIRTVDNKYEALKNELNKKTLDAFLSECQTYIQSKPPGHERAKKLMAFLGRQTYEGVSFSDRLAEGINSQINKASEKASEFLGRVSELEKSFVASDIQGLGYSSEQILEMLPLMPKSKCVQFMTFGNKTFGQAANALEQDSGPIQIKLNAIKEELVADANNGILAGTPHEQSLTMRLLLVESDKTGNPSPATLKSLMPQYLESNRQAALDNQKLQNYDTAGADLGRTSPGKTNPLKKDSEYALILPAVKEVETPKKKRIIGWASAIGTTIQKELEDSSIGGKKEVLEGLEKFEESDFNNPEVKAAFDQFCLGLAKEDKKFATHVMGWEQDSSRLDMLSSISQSIYGVELDVSEFDGKRLGDTDIKGGFQTFCQTLESSNPGMAQFLKYTNQAFFFGAEQKSLGITSFLSDLSPDMSSNDFVITGVSSMKDCSIKKGDDGLVEVQVDLDYQLMCVSETRLNMIDNALTMSVTMTLDPSRPEDVPSLGVRLTVNHNDQLNEAQQKKIQLVADLFT